MTGIMSSISNLLQSILDIFTSILNTIFSSVQGVFAVSGTLIQDIVNMFQGLLGFLLSEYLVSFSFLLSTPRVLDAFPRKSCRPPIG